jgi:hypothetical protein
MRIHIIITICWQVWRGTGGETAVLSKHAECQTEAAAFCVQASTMLKWWILLMFGRSFLSYFSIKDRTSVIITILTWLMYLDQDTLSHCTASMRSHLTDFRLRPANSFTHPVTAQELLGVCLGKVSVFCGTTSSGSSPWISKKIKLWPFMV